MRALGHARWRREGFRETFLVVFTRKGDASALRRLGVLVSELYVNAAPRWWPYPKGGEVRALVQAAVRDVRHVRDVLAWVQLGGERTMEGSALTSFAGRCGADLEAIALALEAALADPKGTLARERALADAALFLRWREHAPGDGAPEPQERG